MKKLQEFLKSNNFSDKEIQVFLAMIELGPSPVQKISQRSKVNRATTYIVLNRLGEQGLVSNFEKGKKTFYVAESPKKLKELIQRKVKQLQERQKALDELMPTFLAFFNNGSIAKPHVKFYEGEEGLITVRRLILDAQGEILSFSALDETLLQLSEIDEEQRIQLTEQKFGRNILAIKPGIKIPYYHHDNWETKKVSYKAFPFSGELVMFDDKIILVTVNARPVTILIENLATKKMLQNVFENLWHNAEYLNFNTET